MIEEWIYPKPKPSYTSNEVHRWITTADGTRLAVMWYPNPNARHTLLFSHGNGEDIGQVRGLCLRLHDAGFSVYAYDYRGYGWSEGKPNEKGTAQDIRAAWDDLTGPLGIAPKDILLHGRSLGGGVTMQLVGDVQPGGVILQSTFTSIYRVATRYGILPFDRYVSIKKIPALHCPVLLLHGDADNVVPVSHSRTLYARALAPKKLVIVKGAGHNDLESRMNASYIQIIRDFSDHAALGSFPTNRSSQTSGMLEIYEDGPVGPGR